MQISINRIDGLVAVDGVSFPVDTSQLPTYVRVIQWDDATSKGWIEFVQDNSGRYLLNQPIVDFSGFAYLKEAWDAAKTADDAAKAAQQ